MYEASHAGQTWIRGEEDFDHFLKSVSLSRKDLKVAKRLEDENDEFIVFEPIKDIEISRLEGNGPPGSIIRERLGNRREIIYGITLPGFTFNEIWKYYEKNNKAVRSPLSVQVFSHIKFTYEEVREVFRSLNNKRVIIPISLNEDPPIADNNISDKRYIISDSRVRGLARVVWELFSSRMSLLSMRHSMGEFDQDKHRSWLVDMFGEENTENMLREWVLLEKYHKDREKTEDDEQEREIKKGFMSINEIEYNALVHLAIKDYKPILQEYEFLNSIVYEMLI